MFILRVEILMSVKLTSVLILLFLDEKRGSEDVVSCDLMLLEDRDKLSQPEIYYFFT